MIKKKTSATDRLQHELHSELENARLVRLLCKFGFINERPEYVFPPGVPSSMNEFWFY
jgi:hypothetical protein